MSTAEPLEVVLSRLKNVTRCGDGFSAQCPYHNDNRNSLTVSLGDDGRVLLSCKAGCETGDVLARLNLEFRDLFPPASSTGHKPPRRIVATYDYTDEGGTLLYQSVRYDPKDFSQRHPNGAGGWVWNLKGVRRVLYHLPELIAADPNEMVFIPEGEKDVDRLRSLGLLATTCAMGAGKWRSDDNDLLRGRDVVILPDNDDAGRLHAADVARQLHGVVRSVKIVTLPGLPTKGDVSDWLDAGGTVDELRRLVDAATAETDTEPSIESNAEPDDTDAACPLDAVHAHMGRFVAYPSEHTHVAHTLWVAHTHLMEAWEATPRLAFLSPEPASGKTRALEITETVVPNPVEAVNVTAAYLFRKVGDEAARATLLYDEIDTVFGPKAKENEEIRGLLNAGHRKGATAGRCIVRGKAIETVDYPAYCAVALAGLGDLPDTILTRSVVIRMRRRKPGERVEPYRRRLHAKEGYALRDRLVAWARSVKQTITDAWPEMPAGIEDRDADVWEPLLAVADAAGGDWPKRAKAAAVALVAASKESTPSLGIRLLSDIRDVFGNADALSTETILEKLHALPEAPWAEMRGGKPLNARGLAHRLGNYGVKSKTIRIGTSTPRGYSREDLKDAWDRYLSSSPRENETSATNATPPDGDGADALETTDTEPPADGETTAEPTQTTFTTDGGNVADVADVAELRETEGRRCIECREPAVSGSYYCVRHGGALNNPAADDDMEDLL